MDERFPDEFVTWHHKTFPGIKVDEIFGMDSRKGKVWQQMALQIYCEQGADYRVVDHFQNGAPFLEGYPGRISITHTTSFMAVAALPKTPEINLDGFNPRSAMGIDAECLDRRQVLEIRSKFLNSEESAMIPQDDTMKNILAWTCKEAIYKCAFVEGLDCRENIKIHKLPFIVEDPVKGNENILGEASLIFPGDSEWGIQPMKLFSYRSYGCCVTLAFSPKCAKFGK